MTTKEKKEKIIQVSDGSPVKKEPDVILSLSDLRTGQQNNAEGRTSPRWQRPVITSSLHIVCPALTRISCTCCVYIGRSALTPPAVTEVAQQELALVHTQVRPISKQRSLEQRRAKVSARGGPEQQQMDRVFRRPTS